MRQAIYRFIYNPAVNKVLRNINKALLPVLPKKIKISPSGVLKIVTDRGNTVKLLTNQTNYPAYLIFWNGYKKFEYTELFMSLIKHVNVFYDIGANIGYYSLLAAADKPQMKIVAFEPAAGPLHYLQKNVSINKFANIQIEDIALSQDEGSIVFYEVQNQKYTYLKHTLTGEGNAGSKTSGRNFVANKVKTTTLDKFVENADHTKIDLIKLDTEGTEHFILSHSLDTLRNMQPIVICETLFNTIEAELEEIFSGLGYEFYNNTAEGLVKVDSIRRIKDNGVRDCFFVPPSKRDWINDFVVKS